MDVYGGVRWAAAAKYGTHAIEVVTAVYVARIVAPECYGLLGMALAITGLLTVLQSLGFGAALIQRPEIDETLTSSLFYVSSAISAILALGLVLGAPLFAWMYGDARVGPIIVVLALTFLVSGLGLVPTSLLTRRLAFQRLAWVEVAVAVVRAGTVVTLALRGWGVWALVWSSTAGSIMLTVLVFLTCGWFPRRVFRWSCVRNVFGFAANRTGFSIFNYLSQNADNMIIGAFLGATPLSYYSLAYRILLFPRDVITTVVMRVMFPAFSRMQDDNVRLRSAYLRVCGAIAFLTFPMMMGMLAVAELFVQVVLGPNWIPAVPVIWILAPIGMIQSVGIMIGQIFLAKGRTDWQFRWGIVAGVVTIGAFLAGVPWGVLGVATSYAIVSVLLILPSHWIAFQLVPGLRIRDLMGQLLPYTLYSVSMAMAVIWCQRAMAKLGIGPVATLLTAIAVGVVFYAALTLLLRPPVLAEMGKLLPEGFTMKFKRLTANRTS